MHLLLRLPPTRWSPWSSVLPTTVCCWSQIHRGCWRSWSPTLHLYFLTTAPTGTRSRKTTVLAVLVLSLKCSPLAKLNRILSEKEFGEHFLGIQILKCRGEHKREGEQTEHEQTLSRRINIHASYHSSTRKQAVILVQKDELCFSLPLNLKKCHKRHTGTENEKGICKVNSMCQLDWATRCPDILSNFILSVSTEVFGDEINIYMVDLKQSRTL